LRSGTVVTADLTIRVWLARAANAPGFTEIKIGHTMSYSGPGTRPGQRRDSFSKPDCPPGPLTSPFSGYLNSFVR
jgi:hypothetical protein